MRVNQVKRALKRGHVLRVRYGTWRDRFSHILHPETLYALSGIRRRKREVREHNVRTSRALDSVKPSFEIIG